MIRAFEVLVTKKIVWANILVHPVRGCTTTEWTADKAHIGRARARVQQRREPPQREKRPTHAYRRRELRRGQGAQSRGTVPRVGVCVPQVAAARLSSGRQCWAVCWCTRPPRARPCSAVSSTSSAQTAPSAALPSLTRTRGGCTTQASVGRAPSADATMIHQTGDVRRTGSHARFIAVSVASCRTGQAVAELPVGVPRAQVSRRTISHAKAPGGDLCVGDVVREVRGRSLRHLSHRSSASNRPTLIQWPQSATLRARVRVPHPWNPRSARPPPRPAHTARTSVSSPRLAVTVTRLPLRVLELEVQPDAWFVLRSAITFLPHGVVSGSEGDFRLVKRQRPRLQRHEYDRTGTALRICVVARASHPRNSASAW